MSKNIELYQKGQSLWYDNIQRKLIEDGSLKQMIDEGDIYGVTSNPSIFMKAIANSNDYDNALQPMAWADWSAEDIFWQLAVEDIQAGADLLDGLYQKSNKGDGYISLEVDPNLAYDTKTTISEAKRLWNWVNRPNLCVKIPATREGIPAIRAAIAAGINVNVTLIFSPERYQEVMEAYILGLEDRVADGLPIDGIASVASIFVSRIDGVVDKQLQAVIDAGGPMMEKALSLLGKAAIANSRYSYLLFKEAFGTERFKKLEAKGARVQRPLWASTSSKNPAYPDTIYVDELVAPHTVNTAPPQTVEAFKDHGSSEFSVEGREEAAKKTLDAIESLGISMTKVHEDLEVAGVKAFSEAFAELMDVIQTRKDAMKTQLGDLTELVSSRIAQFEENQSVSRLHQHEADLWTMDADGQAEIRRRLGWVNAPYDSTALLDQINALAADCAADGLTHCLLLGMGGSSLAPEVMRLTLGVGKINEKPGLDLSIVDSTDPIQVSEAAAIAPVEKTLFVVASKSGTTSEVHALMEYFWAAAQNSLGEKAGKHFVAITDPGSKLEKIGHERGFRAVVNADPMVGGRFSGLISFGLVPLGLMGHDVPEFLRRARKMADQCKPEVPTARNPGVALGAVMGEASLAGRDKLCIVTDPAFDSLGSWLEQLIAESSGKEGKGIIPVDGEPVIIPPASETDRLYVYVRFDGQKQSVVDQIRSAGHPVIILNVPNAYELGAEFYRWEMAISFACMALGVNTFDQPNVQSSKSITAQKIADFQQTGTLQQGEVIWASNNGEVFGSTFASLNDAKSLNEVVRGFVAQAQEGDYIAINAYLPRNPETTAVLEQLRKAIADQTQKAVTLGFGPRFQHSTGQLHKGGANKILVLEITADPSVDFDVPEHGLTFGTLLRAQALGDFEANLAMDRRAIRVNLFAETPVEALIS
ncbi:MAG: bifunctional transaldolase/phosoglucose isomerase [Anaerolineaceae bacterium]|nr:bifunctional transaldolase/phosoglucose isomerase [Anaerolineaceae bacterium]